MIADTIKQITDLAERLAGRYDCRIVRPGTPITLIGNHRLHTIIVLPGAELTIAPGFENVFPDVPIDQSIDPYGWGNGLIVLGKLTAIGTPKTSFFRRGTGVGHPSDWRSGDVRLFPDSRRLESGERFDKYVPKWELVGEGELTKFYHPYSPNDEYRPHVANLTRDIVFRSENPAGNRAHIWFGHRAEIDVHNCEFRSTGRTRVQHVVDARSTDPAKKAAGLAKIGRYPVHFHHLWGPRHPSGLTPVNPQFVFNGNTVWCELDPEVCEFPWGIVLHDSHFGELKGNVVHNWHGYGIGLQSGNETGNAIEGNFVHGIHGEHNPRDLGGLDASGVWCRGVFSFVRNNVCCGIHNHFSGLVPGVGYQLIAHAAENMNNVRVPKFPGADMESTAETTASNVKTYTPPADWWQNNEAYGCGTGLTFWNFRPTAGPHVYAGQVAWNCHDEGVYLYPHGNVEFPDNVANNCGRAMRSGDYVIGRWVVKNPRWVDCGAGMNDSTNYANLVIDGGEIAVDGVGVEVVTIAAPGSTWPVASRMTFVKGTRFSRCQKMLAATWDWTKSNSNFFAPDLIEFDGIIDPMGKPGTGQLYYTQQSANEVIRPEVMTRSKTPPTNPVAGLTNQQAWDRYGMALAGEVMPSGCESLPLFGGMVAMAAPPPPPPPPNQPPLVDAGPDQTIQWPQHIGAELLGNVSDDGFPGTVSVVWEALSWPEGARPAIDHPTTLRPLVAFDQSGVHVFRLLASDGELTATDTVTITVLPPPPPPENVAVKREILTHLQSLARELYQTISVLLE